MCRAGGPRCPQTPGKKARRRFNDHVNKAVNASGMSIDDWKQQNTNTYDQMMKQDFKITPEESEETTSSYVSVDDDDWVNYREIGTRVTPSWSDEDEQDEQEGFCASGNNDFYDEPTKESYYEDLVSDDPNEVNAYLAAQFSAEIRDAIRNAGEDKTGIDSWSANPEDTRAAMLSYWDDDYDEAAIDQSWDGDEDSGASDEARRTNKHLLPKDAVIHSPNPNPVFVYGTLRTGMGNYNRILKGNVTKEQSGAKLPGAEMYSNGGFPYVIDKHDDATSEVAGDLMYLDYDQFGDTLQNLDWLEGTNEDIVDSANHYNRMLRYVQVGEKEYVQAWVYMPPDDDKSRITRLEKIESGDWAKRHEN